MLPFLPFIAGLAAGAAAWSLAGKAKAKSPKTVGEAAERARHGLRRAATAGLDAVSRSSGQLRDRIALVDAATPETALPEIPAKPKKAAKAKAAAMEEDKG
jgi:hypothetical protein